MSGIFYFTSFIISLIIIIIIDILNGSYGIFLQFYKFYNEKGFLYMEFRFFFGFIIRGFFLDLLEFLILDKLSPNYISIGNVLSRIPSDLIENEAVNKWLILIISILQILTLLFYLEILEYNFCSLNTNTKKNIKEREIKEKFESNDDIDNDIEVNIEGYSFYSRTKNIDEEILWKIKEKDGSIDM